MVREDRVVNGVVTASGDRDLEGGGLTIKEASHEGKLRFLFLSLRAIIFRCHKPVQVT